MIDPALVLAWLDAEIADGHTELAKQKSEPGESFYEGEIMALKRARVHVAALAQAPAARSGVITAAPRLTNEEDTKALWLTRRLMPQEPDR